MKLGENICKLRKDKGFTQEQLANCVSVSIAAVSKWETNSAYPDIELLPKIAQVFDVSIDYLMGYQMESDMTIDDHIKFADSLVYNRQAKEAIEYFNAIAVRYPNNNKVRINKARYMIYGTYGSNTTDYKNQLLNDAEKLLLSMDESKLTHKEYEHRQANLCILYNFDKRYDKALEALNKIKSDTSIDIDGYECMLYGSMNDMDIAAEKSQEYLLKSLKNICVRVCDFYTIYINEPAKVIAVYKELLKILYAVTADKPSGFDEYFATTYECIAFMHTRLGDKANAISNLKKSVEYSARLNENDNCTYNVSPLFDHINDEKHTPYKMGKPSLLSLFANSERKEYELIRNEPEILEIIEGEK